MNLKTGNPKSFSITQIHTSKEEKNMEAFVYTFINRFAIGSIIFFAFIFIKKIQQYVTKNDEEDNMYWYFLAVVFNLFYSLYSASAIQKVFMQAISSQKWSNFSVVVSYIVFAYIVFTCIIFMNLVIVMVWNRIELFIKNW